MQLATRPSTRGATACEAEEEPSRFEPGDGLHGTDGFRFDRYGVRVPTLSISPWIREKTAFRSSDPDTKLKYDHTSLIATLPVLL